MTFTVLVENKECKKTLRQVKRFIYTKLDKKQGYMVFNKLLKDKSLAFIGLDNKHYYIEKS